MIDKPFFARPAKNDTFEVADRVHTVLEGFTTPIFADAVADAINEGYRRGWLAAQAEMRASLGIPR